MTAVEMPRKFVVLTTQRSGSNYFCFWLNNHPNVRCHSELFLRKYNGMDGFGYYCNSTLLRRVLYGISDNRILSGIPYNFVISGLIKNFYDSLLNNPTHSGPITDGEDMKLRRHYHPRGNPEKDKAIGFKLMYDQLEYYGFLKSLIRAENIYIIHLIRNNPLKIYLSKLTRRKRGIAHSVREVKEVKVWVNPKTLLHRLDRTIEAQRKMKILFSNNPYLEITSEDFFGNYSETSKRTLGFLGVENRQIRMPRLKKLNPDSVGQIIENYDEITKKLKGTPYERFLD